MSILSCSPLSPCPEETFFIRETPTFSMLLAPLEAQLPHLTPLVSGSNKPLTYTFEHQMRGLVYFHVEACTSAQDLLSAAENDPFANSVIVPPSGLGESTFYEAIANRGSLQMFQLLDRLSGQAAKIVGLSYAELGPLKGIDGSLIDASLSMTWADYRAHAQKAKMHLGFNLNQGIPRKMVLTSGNGAERPFVSTFLEKGETGVVDRGYQDHQRFDVWIEEGKHFVARLKKNTQYEILEDLPFQKGASIFFFAKVILGGTAHQMIHPVFLVGFKSRGKVYWIVTDRQDLTAEQIAFIFSLRWQIETFFAWWKRHLNVYHLISRNPHGVLVQLLAGLITYLLLVIYFHRRYGQKPSLECLRQLRRDIRHESCAPIKIQMTFFIFILQDNAFSNLFFLQLFRHAIL